MECPICLQRFDSTRTIPRLPLCGHAVCHVCLEAVLGHHNRSPACSLCRHRFAVTDPFPIDFTVISGNDVLTIEDERCDASSCVRIPTHYCNECNSYYCENCTEQHELHTAITCHKESMKVKQRFEKATVKLAAATNKKRAFNMKVNQLKHDKIVSHEKSLEAVSNIFNRIIEHIREHEGKIKDKMILSHRDSMQFLAEVENGFDEDTIIYNSDSLGSLAYATQQTKYKYSPTMKEKLDKETATIEQTVSMIEVTLATKHVAIPTKEFVVDDGERVLQRFTRAVVSSIKEIITHEPLSPV